MLKNVLFVGLGGGFGAMLRYSIGLLIPWDKSSFPWATFFVNISGCLMLGMLIGWGLKQPEQSKWLTILGVGVLGGFTTFSSFSAESVQLHLDGYTTLALIYVLSSILVGLLLAYFGLKIV